MFAPNITTWNTGFPNSKAPHLILILIFFLGRNSTQQPTLSSIPPPSLSKQSQNQCPCLQHPHVKLTSGYTGSSNACAGNLWGHARSYRWVKKIGCLPKSTNDRSSRDYSDSHEVDTDDEQTDRDASIPNPRKALTLDNIPRVYWISSPHLMEP